MQALQAPAPSHVPPVQAVPAAFGAKPQAPPLHVVERHGLPEAGHWLVVVHCTQVTLVGSQRGVVPVQATVGSYLPLALQLRTPSPLQTFVPGVHE